MQINHLIDNTLFPIIFILAGVGLVSATTYAVIKNFNNDIVNSVEPEVAAMEWAKSMGLEAKAVKCTQRRGEFTSCALRFENDGMTKIQVVKCPKVGWAEIGCTAESK